MSEVLPLPADDLGDYRLQREVGRGAMGVVYEALHGPSGRRVALKLLVFPPLLAEAERDALIMRFAREARALASVRHPNVVEVFEVGEVNGQPFMAMEYLAGLNARHWLLTHGPMPPAEVISLGRQLGDALAAVHAAGIVHRDIKPDNIVLEADGTIRLTDFGIARMEVEASLTRTGGLIGSPAYMAPEQILGGPVDARSDLFAAGVTLYQLLTGELPFQGATLIEIAHRVAYDPPRPMAGVPSALAAVLLRALEKEPARRFASAAALRQALIDAGKKAESAMIGGGFGSQAAPIRSTPTPDPPSPGGGAGSPTRAAIAPGCAHHPARPAVAACAECDTPLCSRCVRHRLGRTWCQEHSSARSRPVWVTRLEVVAIGLLFVLLLWSLYPLRW